ncbi:MAG: segregation/condensation protein A [Natronospirillum sp.]|uniref:segregation and condensation protein A n=1 Tax=Natronospirillum sp. TaxID=2812955 RepID=UPI0025D6C372|nr:segregation/condensation protein A [Natronospirillum sp.]MCH8551848.1 segregation/condensation protein A [Natronospirillum sp.]
MTDATPNPVPEQPVGLAALRATARHEQAELPFAIVLGEVVTEIPQDLYIPPAALEVFLRAFEGPLDLLLYLIKKQNLDILDINVFEITSQYMQYVDVMQDMELDVAGDYLVMAAMLAEIKSRMLLPRRHEEEEGEEDPRAELIRRLQEYEQFKAAAESLDALPRQGREFFVGPGEAIEGVAAMHPPVEFVEVMLAMKHVLQREAMFEQHQVSREALSTHDRMQTILGLLRERRQVRLVDLFRRDEGRAGAVVSFLAMMELTKERIIEIAQAELYGPIYLQVRDDADLAALETAVFSESTES